MQKIVGTIFFLVGECVGVASQSPMDKTFNFMLENMKKNKIELTFL